MSSTHEVPQPIFQPLFSLGSCSTLELGLVDTFVSWFTICCTLGYGSFSATTSQAYTIDHVTLLGTVSQSSCFIGSCRSGGSMNGSQMSELPASNTKEKAQKITLLLLVQLLEVFVRTHD